MIYTILGHKYNISIILDSKIKIHFKQARQDPDK